MHNCSGHFFFGQGSRYTPPPPDSYTDPFTHTHGQNATSKNPHTYLLDKVAKKRHHCLLHVGMTILKNSVQCPRESSAEHLFFHTISLLLTNLLEHLLPQEVLSDWSNDNEADEFHVVQRHTHLVEIAIIKELQ